MTTTLTARTITRGTTPRVITRGDVKTIAWTLGADYPLTDRLAYLCAKKSKVAANSTAIVNRALTVTSVPLRQVSITLTALETATIGSYHAEIETRALDSTDVQTAHWEEWSIQQDVRQ